MMDHVLLFMVVWILQHLTPNPNANVDDGSCVPFIYGCMDSTATNYVSSASVDDGNCTYCYVSADINNGLDSIFACDSILLSTNSITNGSYCWENIDLQNSQQYCAATNSNQGPYTNIIDIIGATRHGAHNSSACTKYTDNTNVILIYIKIQPITHANFGRCNSLWRNLSREVYLVFFIDWNQDNDFDDPGEWVTTEGSFSSFMPAILI